MNGSLHLSSVSMAPVPRPHWGWSVYFIGLKTCLCIKDPYFLSEISHVHLPSLSCITVLCLWHFCRAEVVLLFMYSRQYPTL